MSILYVTSFSEPLYKASGFKMLDSFIKHNIGDILIGYESFDFPSILSNIKQDNITIKHTDIMEYPFLKKWLDDNKDIIPTVFGGEMIHPDQGVPKNGNKKLQSKVYNYWNKKASLWFRKIATLHYAINTFPEYDIIIWVDCDCIFKKNLPNNVINNLLTNFDIFYHQGDFRNSKDFGFETGFIAFKKTNGFQIIKNVSNMYQDKQFIKFNRWDDGYIFKVIIQSALKNNTIKAIDIVDSSKPGKRLEAINKGIFSEYLIHNKGLHKQLPNMGDDKKKK